jgi:hypothetical protein
VQTGVASECVATVLDTAGASPPSGEVKFVSSAIGAFSAQGQCQLVAAADGKSAACHVDYTPELLGSGSHRIFATYEGDGSHRLSQGSSVVKVVNPTQTKLTCAPAALASGKASTCTATVEDIAEASPTEPGGEVKFTSDGPGGFSQAGSCHLEHRAAAAGSCHVTYTPSAPGSTNHKLTASYEGDATHQKTQGTTNLNVTDQSQPTAPVSVTQPLPKPVNTPPNTTIGKKPKRKSASGKAKFTFGSDQPGSSFQCKLDKKPFKACSSPFKAAVKRGRHTLQVRAINPQGVADPTPAVFKWTVGRVKKH